MDTAPIVLRRASIVALAFAAAAIAACSGSGDDDGGGTPAPSPPATLTVSYVYPASPDPLAGIGAWRVTVTSAGNTVAAQEFADGDPVELGVDPMANASLLLEGCVPAGCASGVLSRGRTLTFDITGEAQSISMWFARVNTFSRSNGTYLARSRPAVFALPDGRVLVAGGNASGPVTNADVYDPATDAVAAGPVLPLAMDGWAIVPLDASTLLLAGGRTSGGAQSSAMVFEYDAGSVGTWTIAAPMSATRNDPVGVPIGNRAALVAGGKDGNNYRASTEAFRWDGVLGAWENGADLAAPLVGAFAVRVGTNAALVGGGFSVDGMGAESFKSAIALLDSNGGTGWTRTGAGAFTRTRSHAGMMKIAENEWLAVGGWNGNAPPYTPIRVSDRLVWDGSALTVTTSGRTALAQAQGGGARLPDGRYLFVGGDAADKDDPAEPVDDAVTWDPVTGDFTSIGATPGPTVHAELVPLADGTTLVVTDLGVFRFNP